MLHTFLLDAARSDHVWSQSDCAMTIANWWRCKHGFDPGADLRGSYHTEEACLAVIEREGGMVGVVGSRALRAGALSTTDPCAGDIGVVSVHGLQFAAILGPTGRWMVKSAHGLAGYRCSPVAAWRT